MVKTRLREMRNTKIRDQQLTWLRRRSSNNGDSNCQGRTQQHGEHLSRFSESDPAGHVNTKNIEIYKYRVQVTL